MRPPASKAVVAPFTLFDHRIPPAPRRTVPTVSEIVQKKEEKVFVNRNELAAPTKKWKKKVSGWLNEQMFMVLFGLGIVGASAIIGAHFWCDAKWCGFTW